MKSKERQIGIFFNFDSLSFLETEDGNIVSVENIPYYDFTPFRLQRGTQKSSAEIKITAAIQKIIRNHKITRPKVHLSFSVSKIIFRTFVIPSMSKSEGSPSPLGCVCQSIIIPS